MGQNSTKVSFLTTAGCKHAGKMKNSVISFCSYPLHACIAHNTCSCVDFNLHVCENVLIVDRILFSFLEMSIASENLKN